MCSVQVSFFETIRYRFRNRIERIDMDKQGLLPVVVTLGFITIPFNLKFTYSL
jgi:hypothetical protein